MQYLASLSILAFALTFVGSSFAVAHSQVLQSDGTYAQPQQPAAATVPQHKAPNPAHQARHLSKQLGLTPDQSAKIESIFADRDARMAALHGDSALDPRTMHRQAHAIELDTQAKVNAVLTPQQQQLFADFRAERRKGGKGAAALNAPNVL